MLYGEKIWPFDAFTRAVKLQDVPEKILWNFIVTDQRSDHPHHNTSICVSITSNTYCLSQCVFEVRLIAPIIIFVEFEEVEAEHEPILDPSHGPQCAIKSLQNIARRPLHPRYFVYPLSNILSLVNIGLWLELILDDPFALGEYQLPSVDLVSVLYQLLDGVIVDKTDVLASLV